MSKRIFPLPAKAPKAPPSAAKAMRLAHKTPAEGALTAAQLREIAETCAAAVDQWRAQVDALGRLEGILAEQALWLGGAPAQPAERERLALIKQRTEALATARVVASALTELLRYAAE